MSRIIALQGRGNCGKTTTIKLLPAILTSHGYHPITGMYQNHGNDFLDVYTNGKVKVGVTSSGDNYDLVHDRLADLVAAGCDVCICACRSYGGTHTAINSFSGYTPKYVPKTIASTPAQEPVVNAADANTLYSLI